jgi:uncharacterized protein
MVRFLDTNVLLRLLTRDDSEKADRALHLMLQVERGEERTATSPLVMFEVIFTLQKFYGVPRSRIRDLTLPIISLRSLELQGKDTFKRALDIYVHHNVSFVDAFNAAWMEMRGIREIYSWDADYDRLPGVTRVEPAVR